MFDRLMNWWEALRTSIWLIPGVMLCLSIVLREGAFWVDGLVTDEECLRTWWLHSGSGDDARNLLTTLVSALITMASLMFSITMVVLSLAANQFGSRLIRTYIADFRAQAALGTFLMTIVYCLLVLRSIEKDMPSGAVPHVSVTLGLVLALVCIGTLLAFLHIIARSMVADEVIRRVAEELEDSISWLPLLEEELPEEPAEEVPPQEMAFRGAILRSKEEGYVQSIDHDGLVHLAERHDMLIQLEFHAGAFVCWDGWMARIHPANAATPEVRAGVQSMIMIGDRRTPTQDLEFSIRRLVEIALRALSPAINDPNTALVVIDYLRGALSHLMARRLPGALHRDQAGNVRVIGHGTDYGDIFDAAFYQIRQAGAGQPAVVIHLLGAISRLAEHVRLPEQQHALLRHARMIAAAGLDGLVEACDRADIEEMLAVAKRKLNQSREEEPVIHSVKKQAWLT
jgi:uncharacterized membrane protein